MLNSWQGTVGENLALPYLWSLTALHLLQIRKQELHLITRSAIIKTLNLCLVFVVPPLIALVIFATYAFSKGPLTPAMAFVVLSLFNTLRFPLVVLPKALRGMSGKNHGQNSAGL